ncbi:hypothetical protein ACFFGH_11275 [Lysobacter korlensis]|uniref:Uncharacterized protein n=1 Tax=Lysobacter korlensis TaxID=553636 RepID=A0ABV6RN54_9GAMM
MQQWWNSLVGWVASDEGFRILSATVFPFVAILVAGIVAALIARSAVKRMLRQQNRELQASAVSALIGAGRKAAVWSSLPANEKEHVDAQAGEAEVRVRLLPLPGTTLAADWAVHQLRGMKTNSANFSFQAEQTLEEYRDRLIEWQQRPSRAKRLFKDDLEQWRYEQSHTPDPAVTRQQEWAASRVQPPAPGEPRDDTIEFIRPSTVDPSGDSEFAHPPVTASAVRARIAPQTDDDR